MSKHVTDQRTPDTQSERHGHGANKESADERRSKQADVGDAPEQGGEGIKPQDTGEDLPATYEPDKRPGKRNTP